MATLSKERLKSQKQNQRRFLIILTLTEIVLSFFFCIALDQVLSAVGSGASVLDIPFSDLFQSPHQMAAYFIASKNVKKLYIITQLLYVCAVLYLTSHVRPTISEVDVIYLTDDIEVPIAAGNGQHGNERFLTESEKQKLFDVFSYDGSDKYPEIEGNGGVTVQILTDQRKQLIYYFAGEIHCIILGASGSGKTRRILLETLWTQIVSGMSVIISDVKGEIYYYTSPYAEKMGYKVLPFDLRNPKKSIHYNFLQPILDAFESGDKAKGIDCTWDLVSVLVGEQKGEPIWYNGECATIAAAILIVALDAPVEYRNLANVYYFLAFMCQADELGNMALNMYLDMLDDTHPAKGVFAMATIAADKTRSSFFTSALGTLRLFTNPNVAEMTSSSDFKLSDISSEKTILYMMIPDEKKTLYPLVSLLITQLYQAQVELANANGLRVPIDTDYDLDEAGNFPMIPVLGNIASAGRSRGIRMNLVLQDYQQLESKYKDDFENIKTNCQLKIYLKSDSEKTLKSISDGLGKYTVELTSASTSVSDGKRNDANYSSSSSLTGRALIEPAELKRIKAPYSVCMLTGEYAGINLLPDISQTHINDCFGLGDKKHNSKLIMEREAARAERDIPDEINLWGVWKEYQQLMEAEAAERVSFL